MSGVFQSIFALLGLNNTFSGDNTFSGNNTLSGTNTHSGTSDFTGTLKVKSSTCGAVLIDTQSTTYSSNVDLSVDLPRDDTIPQNTEGTEICSIAHTAKKIGNRIRVTFHGQVSVAAAGSAIAALFVDTTAAALAATSYYHSQASGHGMITLVHEFNAADTAAHTYKLRAGPNVDASNTAIRFNGNNAGRFFGGISDAYMLIEEFSS